MDATPKSTNEQKKNKRKSIQEPTGWEELELDANAARQHQHQQEGTRKSRKNTCILPLHVLHPNFLTNAPTHPHADIDKDSSKHHPLSKHQKKRLKEDKEKAIRDAERRRLEGSLAPTTSAEYEQLVMSSPNSSFIWVKYMAFLISLGEIDHARAVADRAIKTIHYREEAEKFNVWVAWLNTENSYGTEESTLQVLNRAMTHTDARKMYLAAVDVFERTGKTSLVDQCLKAMCRKFSDSIDVWLRAVKYHIHSGDADAAKRTFQRSLQSLPKADHVSMATQTALLEFKMGDPERGRSMFEGILANYPKRLDLWSVYLDQEISRGGDLQRVRSLFERATHLALPPKKMKFLFKRYLEFEKRHGDGAGVEHVKQKAMEFVDRAMNTSRD